MVKIVINTGTGFDLTHKAIMRYAELKGIKLTAYQVNYSRLKSQAWISIKYPYGWLTNIPEIPRYT
jgi:hypothetical protein